MSINHYELLKDCSDKKDMTDWNLFRLNHPKEIINLKFKSLENFYLLEADMQNINLQWTALKGTKLNGANMEKSRILSKTTMIVFSTFFLGIFFSLFYFFNWSISNLEIQNYSKELNSFISALFIQTIFITGLSASGVSPKDKFYSIFLSTLLVGAGVLLIFVLPIYYLILWIFTLNAAWIAVTTLVLFMLVAFTYAYYTEQQKSIRYSKNPLSVLNFNQSYLLDESEVSSLKEELSRIDNQENEQAQLEKELDNNNTQSEEDRQRFQLKLDELAEQELFRKEESELLKSRIAILETEEAEAKLIKSSMDTIKKAFLHIEKTERSLYYMNIIYGILLLIGLLMLGYFGYLSYEHREDYFSKLKDISISASLGIVLFYATPILFSFSIIIFGITNLNKNIEAKEKLLEKRYLIDLLEATFYAQIKIGGNAKEALHKLIIKLTDSAYLQLVTSDKDIEKKKEKKHYYEKVNNKRVDMLIQSLIKKL